MLNQIMKTRFALPRFALAALLLAAGHSQLATVRAQGTAFTYQGRLNSAGGPATGAYDLTFTLFNTNNAGVAASGTVTNAGTAVSNGLFTVTLDFGGKPYGDGAPLWLQIGARTNGAASFSPLLPRQAVLPAPYAVYAETANATNLVGTVPTANLSGVALLTGANAFVGQQTIMSGNVGIGTTTPSSALQVNGTVTATGFNGSFTGTGTGLTGLAASQLTGTVPVASLPATVALLNASQNFTGSNSFVGGVGLSGTNTVHFGAGLPGQEPNAGKIGYEAFTPDALDIVGAATVGQGRKIQFWAENGANFNGNVGIGTNNPQTRLQIVGTGNSDDAELMVQSAASGTLGPQLRLNRAGTGGDEWVFVNSALANGPINSLQVVQSSAGTRLMIATNGNVGIGTTTPANNLEVQGSADFTGNVGVGTTTPMALTELRTDAFSRNLVLSGPGGGIYSLFDTTGGGYLWDIAGTSNAFFISRSGIDYPFTISKATGFVGIGTPTPQLPLDVYSMNYAVPAAQFGVANCGGDCGQTNWQEAVRLWNQNGNGQVGLGFLVGAGSFNSNAVPGVWIGTAYRASANDNDFQVATRTSATGTNLVNRFYVNGTSGNVGIGTTTPGKTLEVDGSATGVPAGGSVDSSVLFRVLNTATDGTESKSDVAGIGFGQNSTREAIVGATYGYDFLDFYVAGVLTSPKMRILGNGDVGIGTTNPTNLLQVANAYCNGSTWVNASDRNLKQNFASVNAAEVLQKIVALPIQSWSYKAQPDETHIGPVAQDFHAVFGLNGADDRHIATVDENGVALAAIQGLNQKLEQKEARINELEARLLKLEQLIQANGGEGK